MQKGDKINLKNFLVIVWRSLFQASIIFLLSLLFFNKTFLNIVTITFTTLILIELLNIYSNIRNWHRVIAIALISSLFIYFVCLFALADLFFLSSLSFKDFFHIFVIALCAWAPFQIFQILQRNIMPSQIDKVLTEA